MSLAQIFISEIYIEKAGLLTVSKVKVTSDLKIAKIYLSFLENKICESEIIKKIISKKQLIKYHLTSYLDLKYVPDIRFYYDDTFVHAEKINKLLSKISNEA